MPIEGQVFDLQVSALIGPWSDRSRRHPGVIVSQTMFGGTDAPLVVVPMSGTKPRVSRPTHVEVSGLSGLEGTLWIQCEYPTTLPVTEFGQPRCAIPRDVMAMIRNKLAWFLRLPLG
jgi:mRNA-degrading endonuclease toxin of MazEF toxin-antitoxin module